MGKGHGRVGRRSVRTTEALNGYLSDWPGLAQVVRVERRRRAGKVESVEVAYFITSLGRDRADAARLLALVRSHWHIENRLHHVRDVTLGADACRVRSGTSPEVLAALRNAAVYLLGSGPKPNKAAATRRMAAKPEEAIRLIFT